MLRLTDRETNRDDQQKMKLKLHFKKKKSKMVEEQIITSKQCSLTESWDGPCASVDELQLLLRQNPE